MSGLWQIRVGYAPIYVLALVGVFSVLVTILGNVWASFGSGADLFDFTLTNYQRLLSDPELPSVTANTLLIGFGSVGVTLAFALPMAWILARTDFRWKTLTFAVLVAKLAIPGFITAMSYAWLLNPNAGLVNRMVRTFTGMESPLFDVYSLPWICFLQGIALTPGAVFMMLPAFSRMDRSLEEAAWASGVRPGRALLSITFPMLVPSVLAVTFFYFVLAIENFDFVALLGMPGGIKALVIWIYDVTHPAVGLPNYGMAGAIGMLLFLLSGIAILFYVRLIRRADRFAVLHGKSRDAQLIPLGIWKPWAILLFAVWVALAALIPLLTLTWVSLHPYLRPVSWAAIESASLTGFVNAFQFMKGAIGNTLIVIGVAVAFSVFCATCISWLVTRSRSAISPYLDFVIFLSPAVPTIVAAISFQYLGIATYQWLPLYGTIWILGVAMGSRMLAYSSRIVNASSLQIHRELDESARASGVAPLTSFRFIFLPLVAPAILYGAIMSAMLSAKELALPLMMSKPDSHVLASVIYELQINGQQNAAAAISIYMICALGLLALLAKLSLPDNESDVSARAAVA